MSNPIISNISSLSSQSLVNSAKNQLLSGKLSSTKQTLISKADELKNKVKELTSKRINIEKEYGIKLLKLQKDFNEGYITEEEKNNKTQQFQTQKEEELKLIDEEIQKNKTDISNSVSDVLKKAKEQKEKIDKKINQNISKANKDQRKANISRNVKVLKNTAKDKLAPIIISQLTNLLISIVSKNSRLQELVDKTNEIIDNADTPLKINAARIVRNNALTILNNQEAKIISIQKVVEKIQRIIEILNNVLRIIQIVLTLGSPIPIPLPIKIKLQPILQKILTLIGYLSIALAITNSILSTIISNINDLKNQLKQIGDLIELKIKNPLLSLDIVNEIKSTIPSSIDIPTYKGFKFAIREENSPSAPVVAGNKRHYAVAIDTNNVEVLRGDLSFTQDPQDLIEILKLIIDRENLIA